jgi:hypothetical protein
MLGRRLHELHLSLLRRVGDRYRALFFAALRNAATGQRACFVRFRSRGE